MYPECVIGRFTSCWHLRGHLIIAQLIQSSPFVVSYEQRGVLETYSILGLHGSIGSEGIFLLQGSITGRAFASTFLFTGAIFMLCLCQYAPNCNSHQYGAASTTIGQICKMGGAADADQPHRITPELFRIREYGKKPEIFSRVTMQESTQDRKDT